MRCRGKVVVVVVVATTVVLAVVAVELASVGVGVAVDVAEVAKEEEELELASRSDNLARLATAASSAFWHLSSNVFCQKYLVFLKGNKDRSSLSLQTNLDEPERVALVDRLGLLVLLRGRGRRGVYSRRRR
jgi:hypothetical protein